MGEVLEKTGLEKGKLRASLTVEASVYFRLHYLSLWEGSIWGTICFSRQRTALLSKKSWNS